MMGIGAGVTYAVFTAQAKIKGASFSTGTAALKIAKTNTVDTDWNFATLNGDIFNEIIPGWTRNYHVFVKNIGSTVLQLKLSGNMDGEDTCNLSAEILLNFGTFSGTLANLSTLTGGVDLGTINPSGVKEIVFDFSMPSTVLTGETTCMITSYNFVFDGVAEPTIQPTPTL